MKKPWKVICYVDGFNLYHAIDDLNRPQLKGVNLWALAESILRDHEKLVGVEYFSAYATWLPGKYRRHQAYVKALVGAGVSINMGHFKTKDVSCNACGHQWRSREEKESDVRLCLRIFEHAVDDAFDRAIIVSADSDLVPIVQAIKARFPQKQIFIAAPPKRYNVARDLVKSAGGSAMELRPNRIAKNLFPKNITPHEWH